MHLQETGDYRLHLAVLRCESRPVGYTDPTIKFPSKGIKRRRDYACEIKNLSIFLKNIF